MTDDLRRLVSRCLRGEQPAMTALVRRFQSQVFGLCYRMLGQREDAEDAAQETFVRALRSLHHWDPLRDFEPWLLAIAGNRCRTKLSQRRSRPQSITLIDSPMDVEDCQREAAEQLAEEVQVVLNELRDEYRQAFLMFHNHELSYAEISEAMGCPLGTVKTWVHRARRDLIEGLRRRGVVEGVDHALQ